MTDIAPIFASDEWHLTDKQEMLTAKSATLHLKNLRHARRFMTVKHAFLQKIMLILPNRVCLAFASPNQKVDLALI